jgi:hypothetical protein
MNEPVTDYISRNPTHRIAPYPQTRAMPSLFDPLSIFGRYTCVHTSVEQQVFVTRSNFWP